MAVFSKDMEEYWLPGDGCLFIPVWQRAAAGIDCRYLEPIPAITLYCGYIICAIGSNYLLLDAKGIG